MARSIAKAGLTGNNAVDRGWLALLQVTLGTLALKAAGLAIGTSSKKAVKIGNTAYALIDGVLVAKTTAEVTLTAANNVAHTKFNVICLDMDAAGTVTPVNGTEGATIGAVVFPAVTASCARLGFVIVNPTGTGGFVGGSTDLDDGTVVPNAVYVDTTYPFNLAEQTLA